MCYSGVHSRSLKHTGVWLFPTCDAQGNLTLFSLDTKCRLEFPLQSDAALRELRQGDFLVCLFFLHDHIGCLKADTHVLTDFQNVDGLLWELASSEALRRKTGHGHGKWTSRWEQTAMFVEGPSSPETGFCLQHTVFLSKPPPCLIVCSCSSYRKAIVPPTPPFNSIPFFL